MHFQLFPGFVDVESNWPVWAFVVAFLIMSLVSFGIAGDKNALMKSKKRERKFGFIFLIAAIVSVISPWLMVLLGICWLIYVSAPNVWRGIRGK